MTRWRRLARRTPYWLLPAVLCGCGYGGRGAGTVSGEAASCVGPVLTTVPHAQPGAALPKVVAVAPGQKLRIYGYWYQTCHDTNHQPPSRPSRHLTIFIVQDHSRAVLAAATAQQPGGTFNVMLRLPVSLHPGPATVRTSLHMIETPLRLQVRAG